MKTVSHKDMITRLPATERAAVQKRAAELIAQEMALRKLREAFAMTQESVADAMQIGQEAISRIEGQQRDLRLSTLRNYIAALGGDLELVARFPDRSVRLVDLSPVKPPSRRRARKAA